jgi:DNA-directed RNA polymerase subunit beta'
VTWEDTEERQYSIPAAAHIMVNDGNEVEAGTALTDGPKSPQDILRIEGHQSAQAYLTQQVLRVYRSQGVPIHEKHVEVIIRQMMRKVRVDTPGSTDLLPGELVDRLVYEAINNQVISNSGEAATASPVLLGVTRASLNTESFLAAASFQETTKVLTEAALSGKIDRLVGLKENVILGHLIPAGTGFRKFQAGEVRYEAEALQALAAEDDQSLVTQFPLLQAGEEEATPGPVAEAPTEESTAKSLEELLGDGDDGN